MIYSIKKYSIDSKNFTIKKNGDEIEVEPLVFDLIIYLIENRSKLVTREELFENIWHGRIVSDATLSNHIKRARNILGDDGQSQNIIKTIHGRGYQFIAEIKVASAQSNKVLDLSTLRQKVTGIALFITMSILVIVLINNSEFGKQNNSDKNNHNKSIAVLAFLDMSPNQDHEYFSDGISEEILNKLAHIPELRVISRTSSFFYKNKNFTAKEIGEELQVTHILEGSVRKQKNKIRITVQLIDSLTSAHVWSKTYDKTMDDILQVQYDIAQAVSNELKLSILPKPTSLHVENEAYSDYLMAKHLNLLNTRENNKQSELRIKKSIALDPNFAPSWHFLAKIVFNLSFDFGIRSMKTRAKSSIHAINKALELDPNYAPSYATLARIQSQKLQFDISEQSMQKALVLDSNNSYILNIAAKNAMFAGDIDTALKYRKTIQSINPKYFKNYYEIGSLYFILQKFDLAAKNYKLYIKHKPDGAITNHLLSSVYIAKGEFKQALEYANKEKDGFWKDYILCMALYANGDVKQANTLLEKFLVKRYYSLNNIARIYASRGEIEQSFKWLNKTMGKSKSALIFWLQFPEFRKMHGDVRWHAIIKKMGFPDSHWLVKQLPQI